MVVFSSAVTVLSIVFFEVARFCFVYFTVCPSKRNASLIPRPLNNDTQLASTWAQYGGGHGGRVPHFFRGGDIICHVPHIYHFRFCIWRVIMKITAKENDTNDILQTFR